MSTSSLSRRYATALIEAAASSSEAAIEEAAKDLDRFAQLFTDSADLANVLTNPVFTQIDRAKALKVTMDKMSLSDRVRRFLELLGERDRMAELPSIAKTVRHLADERAGRIRAEVSSAGPMSAGAADSLKRALELRTGKVVELDVRIDPSLLGGIRTQIGSTILDGTIRSQLDQLRDDLTRAE